MIHHDDSNNNNDTLISLNKLNRSIQTTITIRITITTQQRIQVFKTNKQQIAYSQYSQIVFVHMFHANGYDK